MLSEITVGDSNASRAHDGIEEAIGASCERDMINPNIGGTEQRDPISIRNRAEPIVSRRVANHRIPARLTIMHIDTMYDDIAHILDRDARPVRNVDLVTSPVDSLVAIHKELFLKHNVHVSIEDDPKRFGLYDGMSECSRFRVYRIFIGVIGDYVEFAIAPAHRITTETDRAIR